MAFSRPLLVLIAAVSIAACGTPPAALHGPAAERRAASAPGPPAEAPPSSQREQPRPEPPARQVRPAEPAGRAAPASRPPAAAPAAASPPPGTEAPAAPLKPVAGAASSRPVRRVALLFPAQGPRKGIGLEARRGAELCLEDPGGVRSFRFEIVVRDEAQAVDPATLVGDLVDGEGVVALVGPLLSETAHRALAAAEARSLPVISPTAAAGRLGEGSPVFFRTCLTMESYVAALADFAAGRLEGAAFATIAPAERYGRALAAAFGPALEQRGGRVVLAREYSPGVRDLVPWAAALAEELRPPGARDAWGVDALFLSGSAQEAGLILPRLAHLGLDPRSVAVVGTSALNVAEFPRLAGGYAEGALLADGFFAASELPAARSFARRFRERHGVPPGAAAAQACAAAEVLAAALGSGAATPWEALSALGRLGEVPTVLGPVRVRAGGTVERRPFFITVSGGRLVEIADR